MKKIVLFFIVFLTYISIYSQSDLVPNKLSLGTFSDDDFLTAPAVSFDGNYFVFVIKNAAGYKLYECKKNNDVWGQPSELTSITSKIAESVYKNSPVYNYDASKLYFSAYNEGNKDIFVCNRMADNSWSEPKPMPEEINTPLDEDEPSISSNDNALYFVRFENNKEKECGTLYVSDKDIGHKWTKAVKLITPLNSGCERTPRILVDNKTLLFSSKREKASDFKLYFAKNPYSDVWYLPKMIGELSKHNDMYPSTDYKGETLYFETNRKGKTSQIYTVDLPLAARPDKMKILGGKVTSKEQNDIRATIDLLNPYSLVSKGIYHTKNDGSYAIFTNPKSKVLIDYSGENMSHQFVNYDNSELESYADTVNSSLFKDINLLLKIYDRDIYEPIDASIKVVEKSTGNEINCPTNKLAPGRYTVKIPIGKLYSINISSEFTKEFTLDFDLSGIVVYQDYVKNIEVESEKVAYTFNISDKGSKSGINCQITLTNMNSNQKIITTATTDEKGNVTIFARKGDYYSVEVNPKGYTFYNTKIRVTDESPKTINVRLQKFAKDMTMGLKNITFETNSADLNAASYDELERVVDMMEKNQNIKVEISAHTDDIGTDSYNLLLSDRRAQSVVNYLMKRRIEIERMIFKGYGEQKPLVPNTSKANRAKNRRVELKITELKGS